MIMITKEDFLSANALGVWKLVDEAHPLKIYVGVDENGHYALEYVGLFTYNKNVKSSKIIEINYYKTSSNEKSMVISLADNSCLKEFCFFCNDIVESTSKLSKYSKKGYESICNLYFTWQRMFKSQKDILSEHKIKGLLGELLFLKNEMFPVWGVNCSISSWSGPDYSKKDFSLGNTWFEVKTIEFGKNTVEISSIEQLESPMEGVLAVYQVERMAPEYNGVTISVIIDEIIREITSLHDKEKFLEKLHNIGFHFSEEYDDYVYDIRNLTKYKVDGSFPKISRNSLHKAIAKAAYEITLSDILIFKI